MRFKKPQPKPEPLIGDSRTVKRFAWLLTEVEDTLGQHFIIIFESYLVYQEWEICQYVPNWVDKSYLITPKHKDLPNACKN